MYPVVGHETALTTEPESHALWNTGAIAAVAWLASASITVSLPDVARWYSTSRWAWIQVGVALVLLALSLIVPRLGQRAGDRFRYWGPWLVALAVWLTVWELLVAKLGWLPKPFFSPPQGLLDAYVEDWDRMLLCVLYTLRLWGTGYLVGAIGGFLGGVALGWSERVSYWGMPVLKLIGPVPATAWLPFVFFVFPTGFSASAFLIALASGIPVAILTRSGVASVQAAYYDVARTLGAGERFLVLEVAVPAALPHVFVGLFMGLYYSFAVLVVAEMLGAKYGLGWYLQWATGWSAYGNMYAALLIMALLCSGLVKLLFLGRERLLAWQKGLVRW